MAQADVGLQGTGEMLPCSRVGRCATFQGENGANPASSPNLRTYLLKPHKVCVAIIQHSPCHNESSSSASLSPTAVALLEAASASLTPVAATKAMWISFNKVITVPNTPPDVCSNVVVGSLRQDRLVLCST